MTRDELEAAIARNADTELLYDKPYEDSKRIRVTGPFTVESLSPHRVLSTDDERPRAEVEGKRASAGAQFETVIIENLRKAGVQGTTKDQRIKFERLEPHAADISPRRRTRPNSSLLERSRASAPAPSARHPTRERP